jgi:hypothetical protein
MKMTRVRDWIATIFVLCLVVALIAGVLAALGKPVPFLGRLFGQ